MKKLRNISNILIMAIAIAAVFTSCAKEPTAAFTYSPENPVQYDVVTFTNTSTEADSYLWEIGTGTSTEVSPAVILSDAGDYIVKLTATGEGGSQTIEKTIAVSPLNHYLLDDEVIEITTDFFWYSAMGSTYLRLLTEIEGQDNPDLIKLYPSMGLGELPGTYTWDNDTKPEGTYNYGYTANYAGMSWDWTGVSKAGSSDLTIVETETGIYKITGTMTISAGNYDAEWNFVEESTKILTISYKGAITPLEK